MNIRKLLAILFFSLFIHNIIYAQQRLTLHDALEYALANGESVRKARLDILKGEVQVKEVRAGALPQMDGTVTANNNVLAQQFILPAEFMGGEPGECIAVEAGTTWSSMAQVQLNQQLFNQQVFTGLKAAKATEEYYRRSEEHTSELQSRENLVCRLLLEKKNRT